MKRLLAYLFLVLGLFVGACTPVEKPTLKTSAASIIETKYNYIKTCKMIQSTQHQHAGWSSTENDIRQAKIRIKNEASSLSGTHFVVTEIVKNIGIGSPVGRIATAVYANIYDCNQKVESQTIETKKPKKKEPEQPKKKEPEQPKIDEDQIVAAASGTGFLVTKTGHAITNNHVIDGCNSLKIHFKGDEIEAKILAIDKVNDLAIIKADINPDKVYSVSKEDVSLLEEIFIAGFPLGKKISASIKTSKGSVTALAGYGDNYSNFQMDAALNRGNSGGPIMDQKGNIVGVAVAHYGKESGVESFNFGVKSSTLKTFASSNNFKFTPASQNELSNKDLGKLITEATIYLECWMSIGQIRKLVSNGESKKAFFSKYNSK